ncbi:hypothetical protein DF186_15140, partial [Enterococcus hirae]
GDQGQLQRRQVEADEGRRAEQDRLPPGPSHGEAGVDAAAPAQLLEGGDDEAREQRDRHGRQTAPRVQHEALRLLADERDDGLGHRDRDVGDD